MGFFIHILDIVHAVMSGNIKGTLAKVQLSFVDSVCISLTFCIQ